MKNIHSSKQANLFFNSFSLRGNINNNASTGNIGSMYRKYNFCKNSGDANVSDCVLNPSCCKAKPKTPVPPPPIPGISAIAGGVYTKIGGNQSGMVLTYKKGEWIAVEAVLPEYNTNSSISKVSYSSPGNGVGIFETDVSFNGCVVTQVDGSNTTVTTISYSNTNGIKIRSISASSDGNAVCCGYGEISGAQKNKLLFVANQRDGVWDSTFTLVDFPENNYTTDNCSLQSISASSNGYAIAGGYYSDHNNGIQFPIVVNQNNHIWDASATLITCPNNTNYGEINSVSASSNGYGIAGGYYKKSSGVNTAMLVKQDKGIWKQATEVILPNNADITQPSGIQYVSASSNGYGIATGFYYDTPGNPQLKIMFVNQNNYQWETAVKLSLPDDDNSQNPDSYINSISSSSNGNGIAGGYYTDLNGFWQAILVSQVNNTWRKAIKVTLPILPNYNPRARITSVSASTGYSYACGYYYDSLGIQKPIILRQQPNGVWGNPEPVILPPNALQNNDAYLNYVSTN